MTEFLDRPLYFLGHVHPGVLDPALLRVGDKHVALFFTGAERAAEQLAEFPQNESVTVQCAADHRAKEELFGAVLARGAAELWLDAAPEGEPVLSYSLERARAYVRSFKRQSACF